MLMTHVDLMKSFLITILWISLIPVRRGKSFLLVHVLCCAGVSIGVYLKRRFSA
uniref:Uncharacterized protein n=1 Tax=Cucumis sativus TaxID=3659 RepID=A0A0A0LKG5_CUCSA